MKQSLEKRPTAKREQSRRATFPDLAKENPAAFQHDSGLSQGS
jgi:hypothetical protein